MAVATPVGAISALRRARMFHPRGELYCGRLEALPGSDYPELSQRVSGYALVRLSGALAKREAERLEVLGIGLRISSAPIDSASACAGDQDLTFATIRSPLTMPFAPFTTRSHDFFANRYFGVAPFAAGEMGRVKLRLSPTDERSAGGEHRRERLARRVAEGRASFALEVRPTLHAGWHPIATLVLEAPSSVDQEALRFDPFRDGRGVTPVGFVQTIRQRVYASSQAARPAS